MYIYDGQNSKPIPVQDYKANVRQSDMSVLGVIGSKYTPIQNTDAIAFMDSLIGEGLTYETAGSLQEGRKIWLTAKLPDGVILGDTVTPYIVMMNTHDGSGAAKVLLTPTRVVCMNTLNFALNNAVRSVKIRHTGEINEKFDEARRVLNISTQYMTSLAQTADKLAMIKLTDSKITNIISEIIPDSEQEEKSDEVQNQRQEIWQRLKVDNLADYRNTGWGLINAVADFADHVIPQKNITKRTREIHFEKIVGGHSFLDKTYDLIMKVA
jgi:phage/plasmid-like protein (TIGR03299 family)